MVKSSLDKFNQGNVQEGIRQMILGNNLENACMNAASFVANSLNEPTVENMIDSVKLIDMIQTANISKLSTEIK